MEPAFGIIGCGNISRFHFDGLAKAGAKIVHVADLNERAARSRGAAPGARVSGDYRAVLADPEVTVVSVLTSGRHHRDICLAALESGKDVICEKTMTDSAAEAREVVQAVRDSGRLFFTAYMKRFFPAVTTLKRLLPSLGRLFSAHVRVYQAWGDYYGATGLDERMRGVLSNFGGAIVKCGASHMIDMTLNLFGRPVSLWSHVDYVPGTAFDRKATAVFVYPGGFTVSFEAATHPLRRIGFERNSWEEVLEVSGTGGRATISFVRWDMPMGNGLLIRHYDNTSEVEIVQPFDPVNPFDLEMAAFLDALRQRSQIEPDVVDGYNVDVMIEHITESARAKRALDIEWGGIE